MVKNSEMQDTHELVKDELLKIYNKKSNSFPEWYLLVEVSRLAKYERNYSTITFATLVYYAIKDLLQPVKHVWLEYKAVDRKNKTVTWLQHERSLNGAIITSGPIIKNVDKNNWALYENKSEEDLNKGMKTTPFNKGSMYGISQNEFFVDNELKIVGIEKYLDTLFKPIIDTDIPQLSFEQVIDRFKEIDKTGIKKITFEDWFFNSQDISFVIKAMKHFNIIDEDEQYITPAHGESQYLLGFIDGLQYGKKLKQGSIDSVYKSFCEKINRPYKRISRPSQKDGSSYNNAKTEILAYITSALL